MKFVDSLTVYLMSGRAIKPTLYTTSHKGGCRDVLALNASRRHANNIGLVLLRAQEFCLSHGDQPALAKTESCVRTNQQVRAACYAIWLSRRVGACCCNDQTCQGSCPCCVRTMYVRARAAAAGCGHMQQPKRGKHPEERLYGSEVENRQWHDCNADLAVCTMHRQVPCAAATAPTHTHATGIETPPMLSRHPIKGPSVWHLCHQQKTR